MDRATIVHIGQYHGEKNFRIMKSGMGVDRVHLHLYKRQDAMVFVVSLATMLSNAPDSPLPDKMTSNPMVDVLENGTVEYDRYEDVMRFRGSPGMKDGTSAAMGAIGVEKRFLRVSERIRANDAVQPRLSRESCHIGQFGIHTHAN